MSDRLINMVQFLYILSLYMLSGNKIADDNISHVIGVLFIFFVAIRTFALKRAVAFNSFLLTFLLFITVSWISFYVALNGQLVVGSLIALIIIFLFVLALVNYTDSYEKVENTFKYIVYSGFITSVYIFFVSGIKESERLGETVGNQNAVGMMIGISFVFALYYIVYKKRYTYVIPGAANFLALVFSGSRQSVLYVLLCTGMLLYFKSMSKKTGVMSFLKFLVFTVILFFAFYNSLFNIPLVYSVLGRRFENIFNFISGTGTNEFSLISRKFMVDFGYTLFTHKPFLGYGMDNYRVLLENEIGRDAYAHNNFIELLIGVGLTGTTCFYLIYAVELTRLKKALSNRICVSYALVPLLLMTFPVGYAQVYYKSKLLYIILALASVVPSIMRKQDQSAG